MPNEMKRGATMDNEIVYIRRQYNGGVGETLFKYIHGLKWDTVSGGVNATQPDWYLFGYVWCDQVNGDYFGHSGIHGPCPHHIKVCITRSGNSPEVYKQLAEQAGPKPMSLRRSQLTKNTRAKRLYVMWGMPQKFNGDPSRTVSAEEYYGESLNGRFIRRCTKRKLNWVILSPRHGIWGPDDQKMPEETFLRCTSEADHKMLAKQLRSYAARYEEVFLYSGRIHDRTALHQQVIKAARLSEKLEETSYFADIR